MEVPAAPRGFGRCAGGNFAGVGIGGANGVGLSVVDPEGFVIEGEGEVVSGDCVFPASSRFECMSYHPPALPQHPRKIIGLRCDVIRRSHISGGSRCIDGSVVCALGGMRCGRQAGGFHRMRVRGNSNASRTMYIPWSCVAYKLTADPMDEDERAVTVGPVQGWCPPRSKAHMQQG